MQHVSSIVRREGEESMNRWIPNRYQHFKDKDVNQKALSPNYHSVKIHHGNRVHEIQHDIHPRIHLKRKNDGNALQGELRNIKPPTSDGEKYGEIIEIWLL